MAVRLVAGVDGDARSRPPVVVVDVDEPVRPPRPNQPRGHIQIAVDGIDRLPGGARHGLPHPALRGGIQIANAATAIAALDLLRERLHVNAGALREGLVSVDLAGRFQVLPGRPTTVLDVAHNPHAARVFAAALATMGFHPRTIAVFGMLADKDLDGVIAATKSRIDVWHVASLPGPRGARAAAVRDALLRAGVKSADIR